MDTIYLKKVLYYLLSVVISIVVIAYAGYHLWHSLTSDVSTIKASLTNITDTITADGYIFRTETPIYANSSSGSTVASVSDETKVASGEEVAKIYTNASSEIETKLIELNSQKELYETFVNDNELTVRDTSKFNADLYSIVQDIKSNVNEGNYQEALSIRSSILTTNAKKSISSGDTESISAQLSNIESEISTLTSQLGSCNETIYAPTTGYYSSKQDGYENSFSASNIDELTYDDFISLFQSEPETTNSVDAGKIATDYAWYVAVKVSSDEYSRIDSQDTISVEFPSNRMTIKMDEYSDLSSESDHIVLLRTTDIPSDFDFTRQQTIKISCTVYSGLRVPLSSVRFVDGYQGVYILDGTTVRFRRIKVLYQNENSYIVDPDPESENEEDETTSDSGSESYEWLSENDTVIVKGKNMYDGRIIN